MVMHERTRKSYKKALLRSLASGLRTLREHSHTDLHFNVYGEPYPENERDEREAIIQELIDEFERRGQR